MPSLRLGVAGTPDIWELSSFPDFLVSRLRRYAIFLTGFPSPDLYPLGRGRGTRLDGAGSCGGFLLAF